MERVESAFLALVLRWYILPRCELCGKETKVLYRTIIEGYEYLVCKECSKLGKVIGKYVAEKPKEKTLYERYSSMTRDEMEEDLLVEDFGERIRKAREQLGMTREDLARKVGIKVNLLAKIENSEIIPEDRVRKRIEKVLNIKLTYGGE